MSKKITVVRLDPAKRVPAKLAVTRSVPDLRRVLRSSSVEHETLLEIDGNPLLIAFDPNAQKGKGPGIRMIGGKVYRGVSILLGLHKHRAISAPVDLAWVQTRMEWVD